MAAVPLRRGLLVVNVGTPDAPTTPAVRRYLRGFLTDERMLDMSAAGRWLLVNGIIAPFRSPKSAEAYRRIWTERGSPLLLNSQAVTAALRERLADEYEVELGMANGSPSLVEALAALEKKNVHHLTVLPLDPNDAVPSTSSFLAAVYSAMRERLSVLPLRVVPAFFSEDAFIGSFVEAAKEREVNFKPDHVLFSFHSDLESHIRKADTAGHGCLDRPTCCDALTDTNRRCYRAQCLFMGRSIAARLGRGPDAYSMSFQSRVGRVEWVKPYTDHTLIELARRGVKRLMVICPAFVVDGLETLEEIALRGAESFRAAGGEELALVPSLNARPSWMDALAELVRKA